MTDPTPLQPIVTLRVLLPHLTAPGLWAVGHTTAEGDIQVISGVVPARDNHKATRADAVVAAFGAVLDHAKVNGTVRLDVSASMWEPVASIVPSFPQIRMARITGPAEQRAAVASELKEQASKVPGPAPAESLIVSTDASIASRGRLAGLGWVVSTVGGRIVASGHESLDVTRPGDITLAELAAIRCGLEAAVAAGTPSKKQGTVTFRSDSQPALHLIEQVRASNGNTTGIGTRAHRAEAAAIVEASAKLRTRFEWVKGHQGDRLNEAADRLAKLSRRTAEFGVPAEAVDRMLTGIRGDLESAAA